MNTPKQTTTKTERSKSRKRKSIIISELCSLSRNGWANAKPCDYEPLEKELRTYDAN